MENYYQILELEENASFDEIRARYKERVVKFHPDKHNGDDFFKEIFQEVQEAYEALIKEKENITNIEQPIIVKFNFYPDEIIIGNNITISWETHLAVNVNLLVRTTNGIDRYSDLPLKGEIVIAPRSQDMNVALTIKASNNITEVISNRLIHLKNPPNLFKDSIGLNFITWGIIALGIIVLIGMLLNL